MRPFWYFNVSLGSGEKSFAFQDCAWIVILLHTERTENPHTPKTHSSASNFCKYPSDIPQISLRHPQTSPRQAYGISSEHKTLTDANRHRQTPKDNARCCLSMSGSVPWHLLSSVGMSCSLETSGVVWGVSGGCLGDIWVVFMEIGGAWMCLGGIWVLSPFSMEQNHYSGTVLKGKTFSPDPTETLKYQNGRI